MTPESLNAIWARHNADRLAATAKDDPRLWDQPMEDRRVLLHEVERLRAMVGDSPDTGYEGRRLETAG